MGVYRTALGKTIDMGSLASKNELTRAVGNMGVNARGDKIDGAGRIIKSVNDTAADMYAQTVGNKSAQVHRQTIQPDQQPHHIEPLIDHSQLTEAEKEIENSFEDDVAVEEIKAAEVKAKNTKAKK